MSRAVAVNPVARRAFGLHVKCARCGAAISDRYVDTTHLSVGEKEDLIIRFAEARGWKMVRESELSQYSPRWVICPTCQPLQAKEDIDKAFDRLKQMYRRWGKEFPYAKETR